MSSSSSKTYLITGASAGLGLALAEVALKTGHKVIATARTISKAAQDHPQIEKLGGEWLQLDVNKLETQKTVEEAVQKLGKIDVLINNAGYSILGSIEDMRYFLSSLPWRYARALENSD
jgi:NADP-dependent 3-hydroxy acid dehydrogenase YdfG